MAEADAIGLQVETSCNIEHLAAHQIVRQQNTPDLLFHTLGLLTAKRFLSLQHMRFDFIIA